MNEISAANCLLKDMKQYYLHPMIKELLFLQSQSQSKHLQGGVLYHHDKAHIIQTTRVAAESQYVLIVLTDILSESGGLMRESKVSMSSSSLRYSSSPIC